MDKLRLQIHGSPCTDWSIAKTDGRETTPSGIGWELFLNCVIAREKFSPDIYLYENNKSMATAIRDQIDREFPDATRYLINSALVSAQNRERYYWTNVAGISMPEDRGILLADVLESGNPFGVNGSEKSYALTATYQGAIPTNTLERKQRTMVAEPVRTGLYAVPIGATPDGRTHKSNTLRASAGTKQGMCNMIRHIESGGQFGYQGIIEGISNLDGIARPVYLVENGQITIKDKRYPIKLPDGYYIIRKLTVTECCRLQTLPDDYCRAVSATQGYRGLGNGWTAEVIIHLLRHALRGVPIHTPIEVLSLYDGIGTGRYCLDRLGYRNVTYYAFEIDPFAIKVAQSNYPDIIQCGDAFAVRDAGWGVGGVAI